MPQSNIIENAPQKTVRRLFEHIRTVHQPSVWSSEFISNYRVSPANTGSAGWVSTSVKFKITVTTSSAACDVIPIRQDTAPVLGKIVPASAEGSDSQTTSFGQPTLPNGATHQGRESCALASISNDTILRAMHPLTQDSRKYPPAPDICLPRLLCNSFVETSGKPIGWASLEVTVILIPGMLLVLSKRSGQKDIKSRYQDLWDFRWEQLIQFAMPIEQNSRRDKLSQQLRNAVIQLVKCGELPRAAHLLTSQGLGPATQRLLINLLLNTSKKIWLYRMHSGF